MDLTNYELKCKNKPGFCREYVLVHMQKGTRYQYFFERSIPDMKKCNSSGLVSYHWLRDIRIDKYW